MSTGARKQRKWQLVVEITAGSKVSEHDAARLLAAVTDETQLPIKIKRGTAVFAHIRRADRLIQAALRAKQGHSRRVGHGWLPGTGT